MSKELDFLETFFQTAIDKIVDNLSTMKDSKGRPTRKALALRKWDC